MPWEQPKKMAKRQKKKKKKEFFSSLNLFPFQCKEFLISLIICSPTKQKQHWKLGILKVTALWNSRAGMIQLTPLQTSCFNYVILPTKERKEKYFRISPPPKNYVILQKWGQIWHAIPPPDSFDLKIWLDSFLAFWENVFITYIQSYRFLSCE